MDAFRLGAELRSHSGWRRNATMDQGERQDGEEEAGPLRVPPLGKSHLGIGQEHCQTMSDYIYTIDHYSTIAV